MTPNNVTAGITFGDPQSAYAGYLHYQHGVSPERLSIGVAAVEQARWSNASLAFLNATTISTIAGNLTISVVAGADVLIGDNETILYVDGEYGRVGIGVAPTVPLHVYHATTNGLARFASGDATASIQIMDNASNTSNPPSISATGNVLSILGGTSTAHASPLVIDASGKVGIGDTNPSDELSIKASDTRAMIQITNTGDSDSFYLGIPENNVAQLWYQGPTMKFATNNLSSMQLSGGATPTLQFQGATTISTSASALTLDAVTDIVLDADNYGVVRIKDAGTELLTLYGVAYAVVFYLQPCHWTRRTNTDVARI